VSHNKLTGVAEAGVFADMSALELLDAQSNLLRGDRLRVETCPKQPLLFLFLLSFMRARACARALNFRCLGFQHSALFSVSSLSVSFSLFFFSPLSIILNVSATLGEYASMWGRSLPHHLAHLTLAGNHLHGPLGSATLAAAALESLDLTANSLTGPLPDEVGCLTRLKDLRLTGNKLTGSLPRDVTRLQRLRTLALRGNDLVCTAPAPCSRPSALVLGVKESSLEHRGIPVTSCG
jgi:Leucine-rich repeat (LRR) protein